MTAMPTVHARSSGRLATWTRCWSRKPLRRAPKLIPATWMTAPSMSWPPSSRRKRIRTWMTMVSRMPRMLSPWIRMKTATMMRMASVTMPMWMMTTTVSPMRMTAPRKIPASAGTAMATRSVMSMIRTTTAMACRTIRMTSRSIRTPAAQRMPMAMAGRWGRTRTMRIRTIPVGTSAMSMGMVLATIPIRTMTTMAWRIPMTAPRPMPPGTGTVMATGHVMSMMPTMTTMVLMTRMMPSRWTPTRVPIVTKMAWATMRIGMTTTTALPMQTKHRVVH